MTKLLKSAAICALITGFANIAIATETSTLTETSVQPQWAAGAAVTGVDDQITTLTAADPALIEPTVLKSGATIGVARIDGGRLIPTPYSEEYDWQLLDKRLDTRIELMNAGDYLKYIPELAYDDAQTDNKIDEIRMTAAGEGLPYVLIYGMGTDAYLNSFGGRAMRDTGLNLHSECASWKGAKAKALLVDSFYIPDRGLTV